MSDEQQWMPPAAPGAPAPSAYGPAAPEQAPSPTAPPVGSWTAPPKPGLIPLRPLTLGNILTGSFQVLRRNPRPTFGFALAVQLVITLVTLAVTGLVSFAAFSRLFTANASDADEIAAGSVVAILLSTLVPGVLSMVALALVQGILMLEIQRATLGEKSTLRQLWARAKGRLWALIGWMLLITLVALVAIALLAVFIVLLTLIGPVGVALAVVVGIFGGLGFVAAAVWLGTRVSLVPSVLMGERLSLRDAVVRSWRLIDGNFWRVFGIQLLVAVIVGIAVQVVSAPVQFLAPLVLILMDPNGTGGPVTVVVVAAIYVVSMLVVLVLSSVALVVQCAATGLIYIDLRMRKEGLDLDLARFVEESSAGRTPADPYLPKGGTAPGIPAQSVSPWA